MFKTIRLQLEDRCKRGDSKRICYIDTAFEQSCDTGCAEDLLINQHAFKTYAFPQTLAIPCALHLAKTVYLS